MTTDLLVFSIYATVFSYDYDLTSLFSVVGVVRGCCSLSHSGCPEVGWGGFPVVPTGNKSSPATLFTVQKLAKSVVLCRKSWLELLLVTEKLALWLAYNTYTQLSFPKDSLFGSFNMYIFISHIPIMKSHTYRRLNPCDLDVVMIL